MELRRGLSVLIDNIDAAVWVHAGHLRLVPRTVALVTRLHLHPLLKLTGAVQMVPAPPVAAGAAQVPAASWVVVWIVFVAATPL
jgi:hypothetical protein